MAKLPLTGNFSIPFSIMMPFCISLLKVYIFRIQVLIVFKWINNRLVSDRDFMEYPCFKQTKYNNLFQKPRLRCYYNTGIPNEPVAFNKNL